MNINSKNHSKSFIQWWLSEDPDPETRTALQTAFESNPEEVLKEFKGRIGFGTAGLRAPLGYGPRRMNCLVVKQTTEGLLEWLEAKSSSQQQPANLRLLIGRDMRHKSEDFAKQIAETITQAGHEALYIARPVPTPVVAHELLNCEADAAIVVTASHNPAADNGYKLYLSDGLQIVSPADAEISDAIDGLIEMRYEAFVKGAETQLQDSVTAPGSMTILENGPTERHLNSCLSVLKSDERQISVLYTALHGVAGKHLVNCFEAAGFLSPGLVAEQFEPDPAFPTVTSPNPESSDALELAVNRVKADPIAYDLVLANDPDGDRLAAAVPISQADSVEVRKLSGDEIGVLIAHYVLMMRYGASGLPRYSSQLEPPPVVSSSIVSSRWIENLAEAFGVESIRTLTGFKWVARPIAEGRDFDFGYEEALGYCVGDRVRDKDGISAALVLAELAAGLKKVGKTLIDQLDEIAVSHGLFLTAQRLVTLEGRDVGEVATAISSFRPVELGGVALTEFEDLALGATLPPATGVVFDLADNSRVIVRPSGTEPKVKIYAEVVVDQADLTPQNIDKERAKAQVQLETLANEAQIGVKKALNAQ